MPSSLTVGDGGLEGLLEARAGDDAVGWAVAQACAGGRRCRPAAGFCAAALRPPQELLQPAQLGVGDFSATASADA